MIGLVGAMLGASIAVVDDGPITLQVAGLGGVPADGVTAVVLNVTAVAPTAGGYVTVSPTGSPRPVVSNLNTRPGVTTPNLVFVKLGAFGRVDLYNSSGTLNLLADVAGYYTTGSGSLFHALAPVRVLDTRSGIGAPTATVTAGHPVTLQVGGIAGLPATGVTAVVLNVTAVLPTSAGFVTVYPAGQNRPLASNLNALLGVTAPNLVVAAVSGDGKVVLDSSAAGLDLVADLAGYDAG